MRKSGQWTVKKCKMEFYLFTPLWISVALLVVTCTKHPLTPTAHVFYFNSFETDKDTLNWEGISTTMFVEDPAPDGSQKSLFIGGGCIQPKAWITFPELHDGGTFSITCWGKVPETYHGGCVVLRVLNEEENSNRIELRITEKEWTLVESETVIDCPPMHSLRLEIWVGGIVPDFLQLDCITIKKWDVRNTIP